MLPVITFGARPKPWSELSLGLGETKFEPRMKSGTSSPSSVILTLPAHGWLAHLGTGCRWLSVPRNVRQHLQFFCSCSSGALQPPVPPARQSEKQLELPCVCFSQDRSCSQAWTLVCLDSTSSWLDVRPLQTARHRRKTGLERPRGDHLLRSLILKARSVFPHHSQQAEK